MSDEVFPGGTTGAQTGSHPGRDETAPETERRSAGPGTSGNGRDGHPDAPVAGGPPAPAADAGGYRSGGGAAGEGSAGVPAGESGDGDPDGAPKKRRRRGSRGGRSRSRAGTGGAAETEDGPPAGSAPAAGVAGTMAIMQAPLPAEARTQAGPATAGPVPVPTGSAPLGAATPSGPSPTPGFHDPAEQRHGEPVRQAAAPGGQNAAPVGQDRAAGASGGDPTGVTAGAPLPPAVPPPAVPPPPPAVPPPPSRPRIGDTRPAPVPPRPPAGPRPAANAGGPAPASDGDRPDRSLGDAGAGGAGEKRRRRRGGRTRGGSSGADKRPVEAVLVDEPVELDEETLEKRRGRERKGRPVGRYMMVVHSRPGVTQIAVLEGRSLIEHYVSRPSDDANQIDGNIYLGRVQNVLPGMEAAFIDIGTPKNAVLYRGDVRYDKDDLDTAGTAGDSKPTRGKLAGAARDARIEQLLKTGQTVLCQVTKNPIGTKGARLTQEVSLPGRFVVLIPGSDTYGISKRLADDERKRLRRILDEVRPAGHGLIVRTAAEGATADELRRDVARLTQQWERIESMARSTRAPALLYREPDMAVRVIREEFNRNYRGVVIDDRALYEEVRDYVASINPELADRVEWAGDSDDPLPVFERYHVHEQIHKALDRKVWLPSGGSLIIERTEALTVIDVNTGKNVGTSNLEETVFRNNLEAAEEIARQLRLRDIGGIIVIDFIDMEIAANRNEVIKTFRGALARDKTRTQVFDISELGLVEMTRKRISEGLVESFSEACPTCGGRGIVFDESLL